MRALDNALTAACEFAAARPWLICALVCGCILIVGAIEVPS